jgi:hypothetical protein
MSEPIYGDPSEQNHSRIGWASFSRILSSPLVLRPRHHFSTTVAMLTAGLTLVQEGFPAVALKAEKASDVVGGPKK